MCAVIAMDVKNKIKQKDHFKKCNGLSNGDNGTELRS